MTGRHDCEIIGCMQITEDPEQEVSILFDRDKKKWCIRVWRSDIHGRAVFVYGIKCCPFCCKELEV